MLFRFFMYLFSLELRFVEIMKELQWFLHLRMSNLYVFLRTWQEKPWNWNTFEAIEFLRNSELLKFQRNYNDL